MALRTLSPRRELHTPSSDAFTRPITGPGRRKVAPQSALARNTLTHASLHTPVTDWAIDTPLSASSAWCLVEDNSIFYRSLFDEPAPSSLNDIGQVILPNTTKRNPASDAVLRSVTQEVCSHIINPPPEPTQRVRSYEKQPHPLQEMAPAQRVNYEEHMLHLFQSYHFLPQNNAVGDHLLGISQPRDSTGSHKHPKPLSPSSYLVHGSYPQLVSLLTQIKKHLGEECTPLTQSSAHLSDAFMVDLARIQNNRALYEFLCQRYVIHVTSIVTSQLLIATDANYRALFVTDLPTYRPPQLTSETSFSPPHAGKASRGSSHDHHRRRSNYDDNTKMMYHDDIIASVIESQAPHVAPTPQLNARPALSYLPRSKYGQRSHPTQPLTMLTPGTVIHPPLSARGVDDLPGLPSYCTEILNTLQATPITYLFPTTLVTSMIASNSSTGVMVPLDTAGAQRQYQAMSSPSPTTALIKGGFNLFTPTRFDYLELFQSQFQQFCLQFLQNRTTPGGQEDRSTQQQQQKPIRILDMGCGTGVLSVAALHGFRMAAAKSMSNESVLKNLDATTSYTQDQAYADHRKHSIDITAVDINTRAIRSAIDNIHHFLQTHVNTSTTTNQTRNANIIHTANKQIDYTIRVGKSDLFHAIPTLQPFPFSRMKDDTQLQSQDSHALTATASQRAQHQPSDLNSTPRYDLLLFNAPWLPLASRGTASLDASIYDHNFTTLQRFLEQASQFTEHSTGEVWIILSSMHEQLGLTPSLPQENLHQSVNHTVSTIASAYPRFGAKNQQSSITKTPVAKGNPNRQKMIAFLEHYSGMIVKQVHDQKVSTLVSKKNARSTLLEPKFKSQKKHSPLLDSELNAQTPSPSALETAKAQEEVLLFILGHKPSVPSQ